MNLLTPSSHTIMFGSGIVGQSVVSLLNFCGYQYTLMDDTTYNEQLLNQCDQIIITPGVPPYHTIYTKYPSKIYGELDLCDTLLRQYNLRDTVTSIGITGTDGKSTTTWITYQLLSSIYNNHSKQYTQDITYHVMIGGNFEPAVSSLVQQIISDHLVGKSYHTILVIEVSSFMSYMVKNWMFEWSIFTNFNVDHLNRHPHIDHYRSSKSNLVGHTRFQSFAHPSLIDRLKNDYPQSNLDPYQTNFDISQTQFVGTHNMMNRGASWDVCQAVMKHTGTQKTISPETITSIQPLHHRTEYITTLQGIKIYSDAHGLTGQAQQAAITSFTDKIVLICGGSDKGFDFHTIQKSYIDHIAGAFCFGQTKEHFADVFHACNIPFQTYDDFSTCIHDAFEYNVKHNIPVLLFSPGCASFDMFRNREHRADEFMKIIDTLTISNK